MPPIDGARNGLSRGDLLLVQSDIAQCGHTSPDSAADLGCLCRELAMSRTRVQQAIAALEAEGAVTHFVDHGTDRYFATH